MHRDLTRKALYDLVWAKPRTEVARQFNISDVAVGKLCRQFKVPAPPPGYWAYLAAAKSDKAKFVKPPLSYTLAQRIDEDHDLFRASTPTCDPNKLDEPLPPRPQCQETLSEAMERYRRLVTAVPLPKPSRGQHPLVEKLVREDERLAAVAIQYSWEQPKYQSPFGKQLLAGLSVLLWWWTDLGFEPSSSGIRHIRLNASIGSYRVPFEIAACGQEERGSEAAKRSSSRFELRFDNNASYSNQKNKPALTFSAFDREFLVSAAMLLIERRESSFRDWLKWNHDCMEWKRKEALDKDRAAKEAKRLQSEAERQELLAARERALDEALDGMTRADQIRGLVQILGHRINVEERDNGAFAAWKAWALSKAGALDIRMKSTEILAAWVADFRVSTLDEGLDLEG